MLTRAFVTHHSDTVATLLEDVAPGRIRLRGAVVATLHVSQAIALGHKVALCCMMPGEPVIKNGISIGRATRTIGPGQWVHSHNFDIIVIQ
jgi:altronate hydrolase